MVKSADHIHQSIHIAGLVSKSLEQHVFFLERLVGVHLQVKHEDSVRWRESGCIDAARHQYPSFGNKAR